MSRSPGITPKTPLRPAGEYSLTPRATIPSSVFTQSMPSVGGAVCVRRCAKLMVPAATSTAATISSAQPFVVSTESFIILHATFSFELEEHARRGLLSPGGLRALVNQKFLSKLYSSLNASRLSALYLINAPSARRPNPCAGALLTARPQFLIKIQGAGWAPPPIQNFVSPPKIRIKR